MSARRLAPVIMPDDARQSVEAILDAQRGFWDTLRDLNRGDRDGTRRTTGTDIEGLLDRDAAIDAAADLLRRRYFPRAAKVTVDQWGVYTWSPTGRVVRLVWKIDTTRRNGQE